MTVSLDAEQREEATTQCLLYLVHSPTFDVEVVRIFLKTILDGKGVCEKAVEHEMIKLNKEQFIQP